MKKKAIIFTSIALITALMVAGAVYFILQPSKEDMQAARTMANTYSMPEKDILSLKKELGSWEETGKKIIETKFTFSLNQKKELYDQGYSIDDIEKAQKLALDNNKDPLMILQAKGIYKSDSKSWDKVIQELGLKESNPAGDFGLSAKEIQTLEKLKIKESDIIALALIHQTYQVKAEELIKQVKQGKSVDSIVSEYQSKSKGDNIQ